MRDVQLVITWEGRYGARRLITLTFSGDLAAIVIKRLRIMLDKPIYVGQVNLDIRKLTYFSFHYDYMRKSWGQIHANY